MMTEIGVGIVAFILVAVFVVLLRITYRSRKERYTWCSQGEANMYRIMKDGKWFAIIRINGEIHHVVQEECMDHLVEKLNHA